MADNISQAQHITELDFDISKIYEQMQEIENILASEGKKLQDIVNSNWKLKDVLSTGNANKDIEKLTAQLKKYEELVKKLSSEELEKKRIREETYKLQKDEINLIKKLSKSKTDEAKTERTKLETMKDQTDQLVKQIKLSGELTDEQKQQLTTLQQQLQESQNKISKISVGKGKGVSTLDRIKNYAAYRFIGLAEQGARESLSVIKDIEYSMMEISRVMQLSDEQTKNFRNTLFSLSKEYGRAFEDVEEVALRYAQAGYGMNDVIKLTRTSLLALNTAELDVENSTNSMIGILQQWGYTADELAVVMDKLNYTADTNAITTQDLVDGLLQASSVAKIANMSFNDTVGILTAMKEASGRSGKEVGNAFKAILSYIQREGSLKAFENMGIDVYADKATGALLPMMDILKQMSNKWNGMSEDMKTAFVQSADMAELFNEDLAISLGLQDEYNQALEQENEALNTQDKRIQAQAAAGVFRRNYYIALMENMEKAIEVSNQLDNATGYSAQENERHMQTLQAKINQIVTSLKELAMQFADAGAMDFAKKMIDLATNIVSVTGKIGGLRTAILGIITTLQIIKTYKTYAKLAELQTGLKFTISNVKALGSTIKATGLTLNAALGVIGLVATGISMISGAIAENNRKQEEARQKAIENAQAQKEEYDRFKELIQQYETLGSKTSKTEDEKSKLVEIQKQLNELYDVEKKNIDLVNGSYDEQIDKLKQIENRQLDKLQNAQIAALNVSMEKFNDNKNTAIQTYGAAKIFGNWEGKAGEYKKILEDIDNLTVRNIKSAVGYSLGGSIFVEGNSAERYLALSEALERLKEAGKDNTETFNKLQKLQQHYYEETTELKEALEALIKTDKELGNRKKEVAENEKLLTEINKILNIQVTENIEKQNQLNDISLKTSKQYNDLTEKIKNTDQSLVELNSIIEKVQSGHAFTASEITELVKKYGLADSAVKKVADGYTLEAKALDELRVAKVKEAMEGRNAQIQANIDIAQAIANRIGMYATELRSIKDLATAKQALADIDRQQAQKLGYNSVNSAYDYQTKVSAPNQIKSYINTIIGIYEELEKSANTLYSNVGTVSKWSDTVSSSAKSTEQSLAELTKTFTRLNNLGIYSIQEQINYYENLKRTVKLTTDNLASVEQTLQGLYKQQFTERMSLLDKEKEKRINNINSVYNAEIEKIKALKEALDDSREEEDYEQRRAKLEETLFYWRQRTGAEARENEKKTLEEIADLEKEWQRKLEDDKLDKQIESLEKQRDNEIEALNKKYEEIKELFTSANIELIATAGEFAPQLYKQFYDYFTNPFEQDLNKLKNMINNLGNVKTAVTSSIGNPTTSTSSGTSSATSTTSTASPIKKGSKVKILSSATNYGGQSTNVAIPNQYKNKAYTVQSIGYNGTQALIKELYSWVKLSDLVQARTGGYTLADGLTYLHKNEFVVNPELTQWLNKQAKNDGNISNSKSIINHFNAPLYKVEKQEIADRTDVDLISNRLTRKIMQTLNNKM